MRVSSLLGGAVGVVLGASGAFAQSASPVAHGSWLVGGSATISHNSTDGGPSVTNVSFAPFGLYFAADRLGLGGTLGIGYASGHSGGGDSHDTFIGIEPTIRYFFGDPAGKLFPFVNASVGPSWERLRIEGGGSSQEGTTHGLDFTGSVGLTRMLATHVGLTGELYYTTRHRSTDVGATTAKQDSQSYGVRFGFDAFVF